MPVYLLNAVPEFPPVEYSEPDGVLAVGGDLSVERLLNAYSNGIFPWYSPGEPIIWWAPDPRMVLYPSEIKVSKSMRSVMRNKGFQVTYDKAFKSVMTACGEVPRIGQAGTWITEEMLEGYYQLHLAGYAHSVEVWQGEELVGGLYGVSLGHVFYGESMFAKVSNASKVGFIQLVQLLDKLGFEVIDCQVHTEHLESMGAYLIPRKQFIKHLVDGLQHPTLKGSWQDLPLKVPPQK